MPNRILRIRCSGCSFNGRGVGSDIIRSGPLHPDLQWLFPLKEEAVTKVIELHDQNRERCSGGKIRIDYCNSLTLDIEAKP